jgi:N-acetyl-anhydromuramyl-L-alanine amidase AmpD
MPAQVRFSRLDVTDRFPMLSLKIRDEGRPSQAEVAIGTDPALFTPEGKKQRNASNFYSTRGNGAVPFSRDEANYFVPPEVLARFIGNEKLYFGVATAGQGGAMKVAVTPTEASPYISIKGLSGRSMARVRVIPNRQQRAAGYGRNSQAQLEWAGDTAAPGMTPVANGGAAAPAANGKTNGGSPLAPAPYDDGFGPMPGATAPAAAPAAPAAAPVAQGQAFRRARGLGLSDDPEARGIEGPTYSEAASYSARALSGPTPDYPRAARFVASPAFNAARSGQTVDRIVIHITDAPTTSSTVNHFTAPGAQASAHYLVGQDGEVVQFVAETDTAWHAKGVNSRSVGIEHVAIKKGGVDYPRANGTKQHFDHLPPTDTQYCESAALVSYLCEKYGLTPDRTTIIGHREADPRTSHTSCPDGAWNWDHFMDLVINRYCVAQPAAATAQGLSLRARNGGRYKAVAKAMVVGLEDRQKARKYGPSYRELFQWPVPTSVARAIEARGFKVQTIDAAIGDLNLDRYPVAITRFPSGWDAPSLLQHFIRNINQFIDTDLTEFSPYDDSDAEKLASSNPKGAVFKLDLFGPDNAAVVISAAEPQFYIVTTINTPWSGDHPVSGHRQFGYVVEDGKTTFYARGADRATLGFPGTETAIFYGGEKLWQSFQRKLAAFINDNGGAAEIIEPFSERFNATAMREEFGRYDVAHSLATARAMSTGAFTVNWDEVELIAQPTGDSCWAAAGAMLAGWRDRVSLTPDTVARLCGRSTAKGLLTDDNAKFAAEMGFIAEAPVCYSEEGFRALLENNGPLWVSEGVPPKLHAIIVTGMYSDGSNTFVRIADPWDRVVGTPGKPGAPASTHATGSRYIMSWDGFTRQYEAAMTGDPPNRQILHSGNPNGLAPNTGATSPPPGYAQAYARDYSRRRPPARTLSGEQSFTLNWDEVQQIAQPTNVSCWATAASIVLGWRDRMSLTVEGIAERAGLTTATGLDPAQVGQFAADMKMTAESPQSYTVEGFRQLLANNGPLWVGAAVPGLHAIVVTGLYSDGSETYVRITDPWDRDVGAPGSPGAYASTHATGSRYIMRWADFVAEYEKAATDFARVNLQILHCGGTHGHTANTGGSTPAGYAMGLAKRAARGRLAARGLGGQGFTINWDDVELVPQPTNFSCWAAAGAMIVGWRDMVSLSPESVASICGRSTASGLAPGDVQRFANDMGLSFENPVCYTEDGFRSLLARSGPLWVCAAVPGSLHAIVVTGMYSDGTNSFVRIADPWDRAVGTPGAPGAYAATHVTGSRYIMTWADFCAEYEGAAMGNPAVGIQILHSGGVGLRQANIGPLTPAGYAMAADDDAAATSPADSDLTLFPPPPPRARALDVLGTVSTIGGLVPLILSDNSGDVSWELDQLRGLKHPSDRAPPKPAPFTDAPTIRLDDWPKLALYGIDDIYAWFTVDWQHNGKSLGNVRIGNIATNDAKAMKLKVRAQIMDDNILYEPGGIAALRVRFHYRFSRLVGDDIIGVTELQLFADGTHLRESNWLQKSTI